MTYSSPSENWRPIPGWEGLYEVSDLGRVRSITRQTVKGVRGGRLLKPVLSGQGYRYPQVTLCRSGHQEKSLIHGLVLEAFTGPRPLGMQALHGPGGKLDNRLVNLSYGTPAQNSADMIRDGTRQAGERNAGAKLTAAMVAEIRRLVAAGEVQRAVARRYNVSPAAICMIIARKTWSDSA